MGWNASAAVIRIVSTWDPIGSSANHAVKEIRSLVSQSTFANPAQVFCGCCYYYYCYGGVVDVNGLQLSSQFS